MVALFGLAGLPSRSDVDALRRQFDVMQATFANLSRKLDRLAEGLAQNETPYSKTSHGHMPPPRRRPVGK